MDLDYNSKRMLKLTNQLTTKHCPCSIEFVDKWNLFVVGTYELNESADEAINKRFGSLVLIQNNRLVLEHVCTNGGVFDFRIPNCSTKERSSNNDSEKFIQLYSVHSNGRLCSFEIVRSDDEFNIEEINSICTGSSMLTCLDIVECNPTSTPTSSSKLLIVVGDSCSTLTIVRDQQIVNRIRIDRFDYPIWSIKIFNFVDIEDELTVFTGSDDCALRCLMLSNNFQDHTQLFKDDSFEGGVTAIELVESTGDVLNDVQSDQLTDVRRESNENISNYNSRFKVLVGSYDEKLRIFTLQSDFRRSKRMPLIRSVSIANAGIWKIKRLRSPCLRTSDDFYLITGMYSGVHLMKNDQLVYTFNHLPINGDGEQPNDENKLPNNVAQRESEHLIYGCCFNTKFEQLLITSFYKNTVYCLTTGDELADLLLK